MIFARRRHRHPHESRTLLERERAAYVLLEEARLRCERIDGAVHQNDLGALHREIGIAGFCASEKLPRAHRTQALACARDRAAAARDARDGWALACLLERSQRAVQESLIAPGISDHMREALLHLLSAQELLGAIRSRGARPAAGSDQLATRAASG